MDDELESTRLEVLKFPRCRFDRACPILLGLGSGFSLASALVPTLPGRENSFTLDDFSALAGFSLSLSRATATASGAGADVCVGSAGDEPCPCPEDDAARGNTTLAAAAAAAAWLPSSPL